MNPTIWGPHYWFFLHAVARHYPLHPSAVHRKIHYRLIMNFHEFIPDSESAKTFSSILKEYPVTPYLDSRRDFMIWTNYVHNAVNKTLDKDDVPFDQYVKEFDEYYLPQKKKNPPKILVYLVFAALLILVAVCMK